MGSSTIAEIAAYHNDVVDSLKLYFSEISPSFTTRFLGRSAGEVAVELDSRIEETDQRSAFFVLTTLEAAFRDDYLYRCQNRTKGELSRTLRAIYKSRKKKARLDEDIFKTWREKSSEPIPRLITELRGAFKFRNKTAHGRYLKPKPKNYDFVAIYSLAENVLKAFPLYNP